jgi:hypothetical protein
MDTMFVSSFTPFVVVSLNGNMLCATSGEDSPSFIWGSCYSICSGRATPASSTTKAGRHDIAEILLKVALNTIKIKSKSNHLNIYIRTENTMNTTE